MKTGTYLAIALALVAVVFIYLYLNDQIRSRLQQKLAAHYPAFTVRVRAARLIEGQGIEIRGISLTARGDAASAGPIAEIEEMLIECDPRLPDLLQDKLQVDRIVVQRLRMRATRQTDGSWDAAAFFPLPSLSDQSPEAVIQNGTLQLIDPQRAVASMLTLRDVNLRLTAQQESESNRAGLQPPVQIEGTLRNQFMQRVELAGLFDPADGRWRVRGRIEGLELAPEFLATLPVPLPEEAQVLHAVRAQSRLRFDVSYLPQRQPALQYDIDCQLARGQITHKALPFPLTDLQARLHITTGLITLEELTARHGETTLWLTGSKQGLLAEGALDLTAQVRGLTVDRRLFEGQHAVVQELYADFQPAGKADVDLKLVYDGQTWQPELAVRLSEMSLTYHKFPMRLIDGSGWLNYRDDQLVIDMIAHRGDRPIRVHGNLRKPGPQATGSLEIRGSEIPINEKLIASLPEKGQAIARALDPAGTFQLYWHAWRDDPQAVEPHYHMVLNFNDGSVKFDKFPYPITKIQGAVEMLDGRWEFRELTGRNDAGRIACRGQLVPREDQKGSLLELTFDAAAVPLEAELRQALDPGSQRLWDHFKPRGQIDLAARVTYASQQGKTDLSVTLRPTGENTSIEPVSFPYKLENLSGSLTYHDGQMRIDALRAQHGRTSLSTTGLARKLGDGGWSLALDQLYVDRLQSDRDLLVALPATLRTVVGKLNPTEPVNMRGSFGLARRGDPQAPVTSTWDLTFNAHRCSMNCGIALTNIYGGVRLMGSFDGRQFTSAGELMVDSLTYNGVQFTDIRGPLWMNEKWVLLGGWADQAQRRQQALQRRAMPFLISQQHRQHRQSAAGSARQAVASSTTDAQQRLAIAPRPYTSQPRFANGYQQQSGAATAPQRVLRGQSPSAATAPASRQQHPGSGFQGRRLPAPPRRVSAGLYGGTLTGDAWVALTERPRYFVQASLANADLGRFALESLSGRKKLTGKVLATVQVQGTAPSVHSLSGSGRLRLSDADVYQLPLMVQLLKVLRAKPPDATAFTAGEMDFRLQGPHLLVDRVSFLGDAVSFYGKGEIGFNREVNLTFHSVVGRNDWPLPGLQKLVGEASEQIMQIQVRGTLDDPQLTSQIFPAVNEALEKIQKELQLSQPATNAAARGMLPPSTWSAAPRAQR